MNNKFYVGTVIGAMAMAITLWFVTEPQSRAEELDKNSVVVICDVVESSFDVETGLNVLSVEMPNGDVEYYAVEDAPFEVEEVALETENLEDYSSYSVVGLR